MNWQLFIPLVATTMVAILGWFVVHELGAAEAIASRDDQHHREIRVPELVLDGEDAGSKDRLLFPVFFFAR